MAVESRSREDHIEDISKYAAKASSYDALSVHQVTRFFNRHKSTTKVDCDRIAAAILKSTISPTPVQGGQSYTVAANSGQAFSVVQFRSLKLDIERLEYVKQTYRDFVPNCEYLGVLGDVHMYVWDLVPGIAFCQLRHQFLSFRMQERLYQTVLDFARFSALAWINKPTTRHSSGSVEEYSRTLDQVSCGLPDRMRWKLDTVRQELPLIFRPEYPVVVQHDDFLENNFHVNEETGHITGVVDWADAIFAPFGISLGGLEIILGVQTSKRWYFHPHHVELRAHFWDNFYQEIGEISAQDRRAIEVARLFGLFRTYGFEEEDARIVYLEALCML